MKNLMYSKVSMCVTALALLAVFSWAGCGGGGGVSSSGDTTGGTTITGTVYPAVVLKSTDGSSGAVDTSAAISVTFNKDMDASTITNSTFTVSGASGTVTYDSAAKKATFTSSSALAYSTAYTATITTGVKDSAGNAMAGYYTWSFTTQGNPLGSDTNIVTTLAGSAGSSGSIDGTGSAARFKGPYGITTDGTNLYVADGGNNTIRKIVISTGAVTTLAGSAGSSGSTDGTGSAARFTGPSGITTDGTNLFITDSSNYTIRKIVISTGVVTTLAGSAGSAGSTDGTGSTARFVTPSGITTDGTNLYVSDSGNGIIRKIVISTGVVTTLAGSAGSQGTADGTGSTARFWGPSGIITDGANLYVSDSGNSTIRKIVISTGVVTTFAGSAGSSGSTDGTGSTARFYNPYGMTTDGTNLYVADGNNHTIRKTVISTGAVTTIAGSAGLPGSTDGTGSAARFNQPWGISTDGTNLFVTEYSNNTIRKISSFTTTAPSSVPTNVTATSGNGQITITWDSVSGATCYNLYCAEGTSVTTTTGTKIPYISSPYQLGGYWTATPITNGTTYSCIVTAVNNYGEGPASSSTSLTPAASHTLSVSKSGTGSGTVTSSPSGLSCGSTCTASVTTGTTVTLTATAASGSTFTGWSGGGCSGTGSCTVTMDSDKTVTATFNSSTSTSHQYITQWGSYGTGNGQFSSIQGIAVDNSGNVYVADNFNNYKIQKFSSTGTYLTQWSSAYPLGVAVDSSGNVYVADWVDNNIKKYSSTGALITQWGSFGAYYSGGGNGLFQDPDAIAVDSSGNVYVTDWGNQRIQKFSSTGTYITQWGLMGTGNGQFNGPAGIAVDGSGNVYVADSGNQRIQKFSSTGTYITQWGSSGNGNGQFGFPTPIGVIGLALDSSGNIYVADAGNSRIQVFTSTGTYITQFGGSGIADGNFYAGPYGIALDSSGNIYAADQLNYRIQKFGP